MVAITKRDLTAVTGGVALGAVVTLLLHSPRGVRNERPVGSRPSAAASADGVRSATGVVSAQRLDVKDAPDARTSDETTEMRDVLLSHVRDLERQVAGVENKKDGLEKELRDARAQLAAGADGAVPRLRGEYDLTKDDWIALAKTGTIKYCIPGGRLPDREMLDELGLAPGDVDAIKNAYDRSRKRLWSVVKPLCGKAIGAEDLAETIGFGTCRHVILGVAQKRDAKAADEAMRQAAEIRAGLRPLPAPGTPMHPTLELFLALTGEAASIEADLAQSLGQEDAHRVAVAQELCGYTSTHGGSGSRRK